MKKPEEPTLSIDGTGTKRWRLNGRLHRKDGPAVEHPDGTLEWYQHGALHRKDGPAIEHPNGTKEWFNHNEAHRIDGPAIEYSDGGTEWAYKGFWVGDGSEGFWNLWKRLTDKQRANLTLHRYMVQVLGHMTGEQ